MAEEQLCSLTVKRRPWQKNNIYIVVNIILQGWELFKEDGKYNNHNKISSQNFTL